MGWDISGKRLGTIVTAAVTVGAGLGYIGDDTATAVRSAVAGSHVAEVADQVQRLEAGQQSQEEALQGHVEAPGHSAVLERVRALDGRVKVLRGNLVDRLDRIEDKLDRVIEGRSPRPR